MTLPDDTKIQGITKAELILLINDAAEHGAKKALSDIGLHDDGAVHDIHELRSLLDAFKDTKKAIRSTVIKVITMAILGFIALATWNEFKTKL